MKTNIYRCSCSNLNRLGFYTTEIQITFGTVLQRFWHRLGMRAKFVFPLSHERSAGTYSSSAVHPAGSSAGQPPRSSAAVDTWRTAYVQEYFLQGLAEFSPPFENQSQYCPSLAHSSFYFPPILSHSFSDKVNNRISHSMYFYSLLFLSKGQTVLGCQISVSSLFSRREYW